MNLFIYERLLKIYNSIFYKYHCNNNNMLSLFNLITVHLKMIIINMMIKKKECETEQELNDTIFNIYKIRLIRAKFFYA